MQQITVKQLLECGVHFGHQTRRWNPKMKRFIFGEKNGIYIINLDLTLECLLQALEFLKKTASQGKNILFVGTKKQAQDAIRESAEKCKMPFVQSRWLGGMLTNFTTVQKSVARLDWIEEMEKKGDFKYITKKEVSQLMKEREKLTRYLCGVRKVKKLPGALFIIDTKKEEIALAEAIKLGIPTVALIDTNCDPDAVDYPIPGNDDAIRSVKLLCDLAAEAINEGRNEFLKIYPPAVQESVAEVAPKDDAEEPAALLAPEASPVSIEEPLSVTEPAPPPAGTASLPEEELGTKPVDEELEDKFLHKKVAEEVKLKIKRPVKTKEPKQAK